MTKKIDRTTWRDFTAMAKKGGYKRALSLTPERRKEIALKAAAASVEARKKLST